MKRLISKYSKYDDWGYRNPEFDKLKKRIGIIIMILIGVAFAALIIWEEKL